MKFTAETKELCKAVKTASKVIPANNLIPEIQGIMFDAGNDGILSLTATDSIVFLQKRLSNAHIADAGKAVFPAIIGRMLELIKGEQVLLETNDSVLTVTDGTTKYEIPFRSAQAFPAIQIPFPEDTIHIKNLDFLIRSTAFAAKETDSTNMALECISIQLSPGTASAAATDGRRIATAEQSGCSDGAMELLLTAKCFSQLCAVIPKDEDIFLGTVGRVAVFFTKDTLFSAMQAGGPFVDVNRLCGNMKPAYGATVSAKELLSAVAGATSCQREQDDRCVDLNVADDEVIIEAVTANARAGLRVKATGTQPMPADRFHYDPKLLTDYLRLTSGTVELSIDSRGILSMSTAQTKCVVSPRKAAVIRIKEEKPKKTKKTAGKTAA